MHDYLLVIWQLLSGAFFPLLEPSLLMFCMPTLYLQGVVKIETAKELLDFSKGEETQVAAVSIVSQIMTKVKFCFITFKVLYVSSLVGFQTIISQSLSKL